METNLFVVVLRYLVDLKTIDDHRPAHLAFLDKYYAQGVFIASGYQVPRTGGVIIAKAKSRESLLGILAQDPFQQHHCAEFQVFEFVPNRFAKEIGALLEQR